MPRFHYSRSWILALGALLTLAACDTVDPGLDAVNPLDPAADGPLGGITAAPSFDFATSQPVDVVLTEANAGITTRYDVWRMGADGERHYLGAALADASGQTTLPFAVPTATERLIVKRNASGDVSETIVAVAGGLAGHSFSGEASGDAQQCTDAIVAINGNRDHFIVDYEAFSETTMPTLPTGSYGMAIDPINRKMYYATSKKVSGQYQLVSYDLDTQAFSVVGPTAESHAMAFEPQSETLFTIMRGTMTQTDPTTGATLRTWTVRDIDRVTGGDVMITVNGEIYYSRSRKVWRIDDVDASTKQGVLINTLPEDPTGGTVGTDGYLYLVANKNLYRVDPVTGEADRIHTLSTKANDLDFLPCATGPNYNGDQDNDGVPDVFDDFPTDPALAFERFSPSEDGFGTLAFEDLWPSVGDYDFNDLVVRYRYREMANANGDVVRLDADYFVQAAGAGHVNGFGVELPVAAADVRSVAYSRRPGTIALAANGVEAGHTNAVIIPFDDAKAMIPAAAGFVNTEVGTSVLPSDTVNVAITFATPVPGSMVLGAPYNPFLFRRDDRGLEVHLPDAAPTALADTERLGSGHDRTNAAIGLAYRTAEGLPWALHIADEFAHPIELRDLTLGYPRFAPWVLSGGTRYQDWYASPHRVSSHLFGQE
ncbi:MAG: LruC domain-containing protein [Bacteroidota bacterium]